MQWMVCRRWRRAWESNAGFSISAFTNTEMWFFTMNGLTLDFLFFFRIISAMNLQCPGTHLMQLQSTVLQTEPENLSEAPNRDSRSQRPRKGAQADGCALGDLVRDVVHVRTALRCADRIGKADLQRRSSGEHSRSTAPDGHGEDGGFTMVQQLAQASNTLPSLLTAVS